MTQFQEQFSDFIEDSGMRITKQRLSIARMISEIKGHPTCEEIYYELRKKDSSIGQATVYRTLKLLVSAGLVIELYGKDNAVRFEAVDLVKHHGHFVCRNCGAVVEIHCKDLKETQEKLAKEHGFFLDDQAYCLYGLCYACFAEKQGS